MNKKKLKRVLKQVEADMKKRKLALAEAKQNLAEKITYKLGPDEDTTLKQAKNWVKSLGSKWHLPTIDELEELYNQSSNISNKVMWSSTPAGNGGWMFNFNQGNKFKAGSTLDQECRAVAIK